MGLLGTLLPPPTHQEKKHSTIPLKEVGTENLFQSQTVNLPSTQKWQICVEALSPLVLENIRGHLQLQKGYIRGLIILYQSNIHTD